MVEAESVEIEDGDIVIEKDVVDVEVEEVVVEGALDLEDLGVELDLLGEVVEVL